jgi:uncharacterized OB-fold protein
VTQQFEKPAPVTTPETEPFWEGCRRGELQLQSCRACKGVQFPPRRYCASCLSDDLVWDRASGRGTVRSYTIVSLPSSPAFADELPYVIALVDLQEGPTMLSGIRGCEVEAVHIGMSVEVEFEQRGERFRIPYFHPC